MNERGRLPAEHPDERVRRDLTAYRLVCPCGAAGTVTGVASAAAMLRAHPCGPHLAGPYAEPVRGGGRR